MNGTPLRTTVVISNPQGLHMRPITAFVERAGKFRSSIYLSKHEGQRINGKSPLALLGLAAEQGTELILEVSGPDEQDALTTLADFLVTFKTEEDLEAPTT